SYVRQEQKKESDLDLLVEFSNEDGLGLLEFINLENFLSEELNIKVDLVMKDSLKETIKSYIMKEAVHII
ncbi:MAG: nucleotidyltransferase domain-containing protein, partial [Leptospiraceae bacterium]|nr:nucleotidyltransferase domain-containing protein [Leptospiraceae bacterium]